MSPHCPWLAVLLIAYLVDSAQIKINDDGTTTHRRPPRTGGLKINLEHEPAGLSGPHQALALAPCVNMTTNEYIYRVCHFDVITQQRLNVEPPSGWLLGAWSGWKVLSQDSSKIVRSGKRMMYDSGDPCASGKRRSTEVVLSCGAKTQLLNITEPASCTYLMNLEEPSICKPGELEALTQGGAVNVKISSPCEDHNENCANWAKSGECDKNPSYMRESCTKSCGCPTPAAASQSARAAPGMKTEIANVLNMLMEMKAKNSAAATAVHTGARVAIIWHTDTLLTKRHYLAPANYTVAQLISMMNWTNSIGDSANYAVFVSRTQAVVDLGSLLSDLNATHQERGAVYLSLRKHAGAAAAVDATAVVTAAVVNANVVPAVNANAAVPAVDATAVVTAAVVNANVVPAVNANAAVPAVDATAGAAAEDTGLKVETITQSAAVTPDTVGTQRDEEAELEEMRAFAQTGVQEASAVTTSAVTTSVDTDTDTADTVTADTVTVTADTVTANTVTADTVTANTDTADTVTADTAVTADAVTPDTADAVTADTVTADTVTANTVTADTVTVTADTVTANTVTADTVTANTVTANTDTADTVTVTADTVTADTVTADTVTADTVTADTDTVKVLGEPAAPIVSANYKKLKKRFFAGIRTSAAAKANTAGARGMDNTKITTADEQELQLTPSKASPAISKKASPAVEEAEEEIVWSAPRNHKEEAAAVHPPAAVRPAAAVHPAAVHPAAVHPAAFHPPAAVHPAVAAVRPAAFHPLRKPATPAVAVSPGYKKLKKGFFAGMRHSAVATKDAAPMKAPSEAAAATMAALQTKVNQAQIKVQQALAQTGKLKHESGKSTKKHTEKRRRRSPRHDDAVSKNIT